MPLCPWQTTHAAAFERPACGSAATAPGATPSAIAATSDNDVTGCRLLAGVADAVDRSGKVVRNQQRDRKSTRLNSSHSQISYAVFCLKKKKASKKKREGKS